MKVKDILTTDFNPNTDIQSVVDLQVSTEESIINELENYILTDGLAKLYDKIVNKIKSENSETGVWISGFYGSGKSYFAKMLSLLLSNKNILGTNSRERILYKFDNIEGSALIKNNIYSLDSQKFEVISFDLAKQNANRGLAYILFSNFLKQLALPQNDHGYLLYTILYSLKDFSVDNVIKTRLNLEWHEVSKNRNLYIPAIKNLFKSVFGEQDYQNVLKSIETDSNNFDSTKLMLELENYLEINSNQKIIFLFDEVSASINDKKIKLLDLEGLSESLSSLGGNVWTIAIAQERLDDIINNSTLSKAQLNKLTDRFRTDIHLTSTDVDVIIRNRLLKKTETGIQKLTEHYNKNSGKIADHASIHGAGISKTDSADNYATYYPFYKYQFDLLQNFLFGTKGYASTKVAARGMIITTYDILKQEVQHTDLFHTVTGWHIAKEGQPQPPVRLVSRYDNAERILSEAGSSISGRKLLETINFLTEAEVTPSTLPNIIKSFISDPDDQFKVQDDITKALEVLTEAKMLLDTNKTYRITSDIEQRLLDEMNGFTVQGFVKKKQLVTAYKAAQFTKTIAKVTDTGLQYDFFITTDNDDELTTPNLKYLKLKVKSVYNISDSRTTDIDALKVQHQNDKDLLWLVPDNSYFKELDRLIDEVERITYLEQKYNNPNSEEGKILISFSTAKGEKQSRIKDLVEDSLQASTAIYLYNTLQLNNNNWQTTLQAQQRAIIQNVYSKRLASQLSDSVAAAVIKEANIARLPQYFTGIDFIFFDAKGNFIGENLKVSEEILYKVRNTFVDGATLEKDLEQPPAGFTYGTVISSVAALMRAGKIIAKFNGAEKFSWRDEGVTIIFATASNFRKASFKAVSKSLSTSQKQEIAQFLLDIEVEKYIGRKIDYNTNDFELVTAVRDTAKHFADKVSTLRNSEKEFDKLFPKAGDNSAFLADFTGAVSEANYIDKAIEFLSAKDSIFTALQSIEEVEKFIRNNLPKVKEWKTFIHAVQDELTKAATTNEAIEQLKNNFESNLLGDVIKNFAVLQQSAQKIKDEYQVLFSTAMKDCTAKYSEIEALANELINEINALPAQLNISTLSKANALVQYAKQRIQPSIAIEFDVKDKHSRFTYSEVLSFVELYASKKTEVDILRAGLIREKAPEPQPGVAPTPIIKKYAVRMPNKQMKVAEYKKWLQSELQKLASASDNDEILIEN